MNNLRRAVVVMTFSLLWLTPNHAQKESVILYNSQPVKVELSEKGNIKSFIGLVPGYMNGYILSTVNSEEKAEEVNEPAATEVLKDNAGYAVVSTERIELRYPANFATLDKATINTLNEISARLKQDPELKILITAHTRDQQKSTLSTNRLASATAYLGIKGIRPDRIRSEIQKSTEMLDILTINYWN